MDRSLQKQIKVQGGQQQHELNSLFNNTYIEPQKQKLAKCEELHLLNTWIHWDWKLTIPEM